MKSAKKLPIESNPEILHGTPVFKGTRVPVQTLFEYLEGGETIDDFLEQFPSVKRQHVLSVLEQSKDRLLSSVA